MIEAYVVGISTGYENEDIQVRYRIYKEQELVREKSVWKDYAKPLVVNHAALLTLLKDLKKYYQDELTIFINDAALSEQIRGTCATKNKDVQKMAERVRKELSKFDSVTVKDVSRNHAELVKWDEILKFIS